MAQVAPIEDSAAALSRSTSPSIANRTSGDHSRRSATRLTIGFPILPPPSQPNREKALSLSTKHSSATESASSSPRLVAQPISPTDSGHFLTTLAAQERRVLELREELQKAEKDLTGLKRQWATFEANRKKTGSRHVEKLQPLSAALVSKTDTGGEVPVPLNSSTFEKLSTKPPRKPQQRVFSGSRHTRTLSLLTPASGSSQPSFPHPFSDAYPESAPGPRTDNTEQTLSRSSTMPNVDENVAFGRTYKDLANRRSMPPPSTDALVKTGKQMASDFRDGLWTFFEDIRQATVGEEGINGTDGRVTNANLRPQTSVKHSPTNGVARKKRSSTGLQDPTRIVSGENTDGTAHRSEHSFWKEFGLDTPGRRQAQSKKLPLDRQKVLEQPQESLVDIDDNWDAWDSPAAHEKLSRREPGGTSGGTHNNGGGLPWPELPSLTPSKLTRRVSDLMRDWENDHHHPGQDATQLEMGEHALISPHI